MLEAMQEQRVTVLGKEFHLESPFMVLATQNPVEQEGTYPLPEAQLDRFMSLIELDYPNEEEEIQIAKTTTGDALPDLEHVMSASEIIAHQHLVRRVPVPDHIYTYAARLVRRTRPAGETAPAWLKPLVSWGAGPRAVQNLILGAKARAALYGSYMVRLEDVKAVASAVLTHRIITHFRGSSREGRLQGYHPAIGSRDAGYLMTTERQQRSFIDPAVLAQLSALPLVARKAMLGNVSGRHSSPHRGASVEFAEYRKYVPGDDLRRLDWRTYGRSDRFYVKEFEADTNLRMVLVVDTSGSMGMPSIGGTKFQICSASRRGASLRSHRARRCSGHVVRG